MALALARLAAMAAATLDFFTWGVAATVGSPARSSGLGHAFSSCLRELASRDSSNARPRSRHTSSNTQNAWRAVSFTAGFGSLRPFLRHFSNVSTPPMASMACFARCPCAVR